MNHPAAQLISASANDSLDLLLEELCLELGLTETQHRRASQAYSTVGDWLTNDEGALGALRPRVFPQGSIPLGTAVRPRDSDKFDADGVCLLQDASALYSPESVYRLVSARIREHGTYRDRVQEEPRCLRIDYEGGLHLDIIPAVPSGDRILVPNRSRTAWDSTHPLGYQAWFENIGRPVVFAEKRADADPMPPFRSQSDKTALHRTVQLMKRRREVYFDGSDIAPKSILLTTLVGQTWPGARLASDGLLAVLKQVEVLFPVGSSPKMVSNPVNAGENLARHWLEVNGAYSKFTAFVADFRRQMEAVLSARGTEAVARLLEEIFDPQRTGIVKSAVANFTERFQRDRANGHILARGTATGATAAAARAIPRNQFYGR